jgi:hypothetical protein
MIVGWERGRLEDEDILAAHVFLDFDEDFLVGEAPDDLISIPNCS